MAGCIKRCTTFRTDNVTNAWLDIRDHFGPRVTQSSSIYTTDMSEWAVWAAENGADPVTDVVKFGNWLIWKCSFGTTNYGNLATRVRDHVGITGVPCPYDSGNYDVTRSILWLGSVPATTNDHGSNYMRVSQRGNAWGFECTYSGCPYQTSNGYPYFHA